tara:strand:+ start:95 stop:550 length:456 start_codon:yes stop_codon:yes gene_type:complete
MVQLVPITEKWGDSELVFKPTANGDDENMSEIYTKKERNLVWMKTKAKGARKWTWYGDVFHIDRAIDRLLGYGCDLDKGKELPLNQGHGKGWILKDKNGRHWSIQPITVEHSRDFTSTSKGTKLRDYLEQQCKEHNHRVEKWEDAQDYEVA